MYILSLFFFYSWKNAVMLQLTYVDPVWLISFAFHLHLFVPREKEKNIKSNMEQFKKIRPIKRLSQTLSMAIDSTEIGRSWMMTKTLFYSFVQK